MIGVQQQHFARIVSLKVTSCEPPAEQEANQPSMNENKAVTVKQVASTELPKLSVF